MKIESIRFEANNMIINLDGICYNFNLELISKKLLNVSQAQKDFYKISPSGYGIHWPLIDEDLSIEALLKNRQ